MDLFERKNEIETRTLHLMGGMPSYRLDHIFDEYTYTYDWHLLGSDLQKLTEYMIKSCQVNDFPEIGESIYKQSHILFGLMRGESTIRCLAKDFRLTSPIEVEILPDSSYRAITEFRLVFRYTGHLDQSIMDALSQAKPKLLLTFKLPHLERL